MRRNDSGMAPAFTEDKFEFGSVVVAGSRGAILSIIVPTRQLGMPPKEYQIYGDEASLFGEDGLGSAIPNGQVSLTGLNFAKIVSYLHNPSQLSAKHATFSRSGNSYSRIARLIQVGYSILASQAEAKVSSGVRVRWSGKDLIRYAGNWQDMLRSNGVLTQSASATREYYTQGHLQLGVLSGSTEIYAFSGDTTIQRYSPQQVSQQFQQIEEDKKGRSMVNF